MDVTRAYAYLATNGSDGRSPHFTSDVIGALKQRGYDARLTGVQYNPFSITIQVDGKEILLRHAPGEQTTRESWFHVVSGQRFVRVNAARRVQVMYGMQDAATMLDVPATVSQDWIANWPREVDVGHGLRENTRRYAKRMLDKEFVPLACGYQDYLSETAVRDAVELLLLHPANIVA